MIPRAQSLVTLIVSIAVVNAPAPADDAPFEPAGLYLTWQRDPTTTITIDWHTLPGPEDANRESAIIYRPLDNSRWRTAQADARPFPFSGRTIHRVELTGLEPDALYEFRLGEAGRAYRFRTMPQALDEPLRFAVGGDVRHRQSWMERMNRVVMEHEPQFMVWGGDLAYADGREDRVDRWYEFFDAILNTLITDDGRVIPIIVGIGNHEVLDHLYNRADDFEPTDEWRAKWAPYFFELFAFPGQPGYNALDFGDYLSLIVLDTAHANPVKGEQTRWLRKTLDERRGAFTHIIPIQHVPAYPSVRAFTGEESIWGRVSVQIREHWSPLFEEAGVRVVFEHHDHAYKRTPPIKAEEVHEDGIVYIGDGAWGVNLREVHDVDATWYLQRAESIHHGLIVTMERESIHVLAVSSEGENIDETHITSVPAPREVEPVATSSE